MLQLNELKPGDTYNDKKYKVRDNDGKSVGLVRLSDGWLLRFHDFHPSFKLMVKKDI